MSSVASTATYSDFFPKYAFAAIGRHRALFLIIIAAVMAINGLVLVALDRIYTAEAVLQVDDRQKFIDKASLLNPLNVETGALKSEIDRLRAPSTALQVMDDLHLLAEPEFRKLAEPGLLQRIERSAWSAFASLPNHGLIAAVKAEARELLTPPDAAQRQAKWRADALERFLDHLVITNEPRTHTLRIRYRSKDPELSAKVANSVADAYVRSELNAKRQVAQTANSWFARELSDLRSNVQAAEQRLASYREDHQLGGYDVAPPSYQQLKDLNEKLIVATADHAQAASRYEHARQAAKLNRLEMIQDALGSPSMQYLKQRRSDLQRKLAELREHYGNRHIRIIETRGQLADADAKIREELSKILSSLRSEVDIALSRRQSLQAELDKLQNVVALKDHAQVQARAYEREVEASRSLLNNVLQRSKELQAASGLQLPGVKIVSSALVPVEPSSPKVILILVLGAICATVFSASAVIAADHLNQSVRNINRGEALLGVPALGWIPKAKAFGLEPIHQIPLAQPFAPYSESIRSLATLLRTRLSAPGPILLVASAAPGEGKTTFALSYALSLAAARQSCLLIDADLRRPSVARRLQSRSDMGLADVLLGRTSLWEAIEREEKTGLHFLGAGTCDCDPLEIFNTSALEALLRTASARYRHVILDVPPLLAVSDALLLARFSDAAILVVKWGETPARLAGKATRQLREAGVQDISFVLSQVDVKRLSRAEDERYSAQYLSKYGGRREPVIHLRKARDDVSPNSPPLNWVNGPAE